MGVQFNGELIGRKVTVLKSKNKANEGIAGEITNETMNTITIKTKKGEKVMAKDQSVFGIMDNGNLIGIEGALLKRRPEDRVKMQ